MTQRALKHGAMTHIWRTGGVRIEAAKALAGKGTKKVLGKAAAATKKAAKQAKPRKMLQKQMLKDAAAGAIAGGITGAVAGGPADATVGTSGEVVGGASGAYAEGETWFSVFYFFFYIFCTSKKKREREKPGTRDWAKSLGQCPGHAQFTLGLWVVMAMRKFLGAWRYFVFWSTISFFRR